MDRLGLGFRGKGNNICWFIGYDLVLKSEGKNI